MRLIIPFAGIESAWLFDKESTNLAVERVTKTAPLTAAFFPPLRSGENQGLETDPRKRGGSAPGLVSDHIGE